MARNRTAVYSWTLIIFATLALLVAWVAAQAQQQQRGTGYVATHASWEKQDGRRLVTFPIDHSARPWGPDGGPPAKDAIFDAPNWPLYLQRYAQGGPQPSYEDPTVPGSKVFGRGIGAWGEAMDQNVEGLKRWCRQQSPEHQARWDCEPTVEEAWDAAFSQPRNGAFYRTGPLPTPTPRVTPRPSPTPAPTATPPPRATVRAARRPAPAASAARLPGGHGHVGQAAQRQTARLPAGRVGVVGRARAGGVDEGALYRPPHLLRGDEERAVTWSRKLGIAVGGAALGMAAVNALWMLGDRPAGWSGVVVLAIGGVSCLYECWNPMPASEPTP